MHPALIVFLGGGIGSVLRYLVSLGVLRMGWTQFPVATLAVNVLGGFAMGLAAGWFALRGGAPQSWRLFLATGLMGGFTTFSAFSLETVLLYEEGRTGAAAAYVGLSVVLSVAALAAGLAVARALD